MITIKNPHRKQITIYVDGVGISINPNGNFHVNTGNMSDEEIKFAKESGLRVEVETAKAPKRSKSPESSILDDNGGGLEPMNEG